MVVYMEDEYNQLLQKWKDSDVYWDKQKQGFDDENIREQVILHCVDPNSTGQSKINTLAFVKAILSYCNSEKEGNDFNQTKSYPLIIDSPFVDISSENLKRSSNELHSFSKQVILMIDEDKYESLHSAFDPFTAKKYRFIKSDKQNYSTIKEEK